MRIILHIGTYKTGTSSLQHFLMENRTQLEKEYGVLYPLPNTKRMVNQHAHIVESILNEDWDTVRKYIKDAKSEASLKNCQTIILSSEAFSSLNRSQVTSFIELVDSNVEVVIYFRNVYKYIVSTLSQLLKSPEQNLFSGKIVAQLKRRLDYDHVISVYDKHQSVDLYVNSYERVDDIVQHFFISRLDFEPKYAIFSTSSIDKVNKSINFNVMLLLVLFGLIESHQDHEVLYRKIIKDKLEMPSKLNSEMFLARTIYGLLGTKLTHPLVEPLLDDLLKFDDSALPKTIDGSDIGKLKVILNLGLELKNES